MPNVSNKKKRANKQLKQKAQKQNGKWSKIQTAYEEGNQTVKQICHDYKIKQTELYKHAKENNWPLRTKQKRKANSNEHSAIEKSTILVTSETEIRKPTETLQDALEFITMDLMQRIQKRTIESEADHDKDARTLSSLVRTYEKLKEMKTSSQSSSQKGGQKHLTINKADEDAKRREIATSLEKLIQGL